MYFTLSTVLLAATAYASPLLEQRQSTCPSGAGITAARAAQVKAAFQRDRIIPDTVPDINPKVELTVKYGNRNENLGNEFSVPETIMEPTISFPPELGFSPTTTKYTYIQVDPDAPGPSFPILRHFLHHIIYDLQPSCVPNQSPKTQARYMALTPLSVQAHRYISLVYRQPPNYTPPKIDPVTEVVRAPFNLQKYVNEGGLVLVGGNYMKEGLGTTLCALVPGCTASGIGGPTSAEGWPDITKFL